MCAGGSARIPSPPDTFGVQKLRLEMKRRKCDSALFYITISKILCLLRGWDYSVFQKFPNCWNCFLKVLLSWGFLSFLLAS